ncbi:Uma2 family endonuclease [Streptomyces mirabilis]|uniref:Putative restriction endonuclease n=1 Tax=Streptomyces mirabilis TaxID=68239 RepID=A0A1I2I898_9ACTN|nr:Uma2 family endonuclease [Streptomyces mirabilis]SFF38495.1 Putative restriction endonuclease [Streptomyces mirabilis]
MPSDLGGSPPDDPHQETLTWLIVEFSRIGARRAGLSYVQGIGCGYRPDRDTATKVDIYARANVPVYLVADRRHDEVLLYRHPVDGKYSDPLRFERGRSVPVPDSVGVALDLAVDTLLDGDD